MFSENGNGMKFNAVVEYTYANDWMLFALWYSMQKTLPDAELIINCISPKKLERQFFSWCKRCNVIFSFGESGAGVAGIAVKPAIIMIREMEEGLGISDINSVCSNCRDDKFTSFVSYGIGFGNFVTADWINTMECPFPWADRFMTALAGANEVKVLKLWKQLSPMYATVSRG